MADQTKGHWITILIVLMVIGFGGTIWMLGKAMDTRFDALETKIEVTATSIISSIESLRPAPASKAAPAAAPTEAVAGDDKATDKGPDKAAPPAKAEKK